MIWIYLIGGLLSIWILVVWGFVAISHAKALRDSGHEFSKWSKLPLYLLLVIFGITDVLFNITFGTWIFRELPREGFFTDRVKRHIKMADFGSRELSKAKYWKKILNAYDPGHV